MPDPFGGGAYYLKLISAILTKVVWFTRLVYSVLVANLMVKLRLGNNSVINFEPLGPLKDGGDWCRVSFCRFEPIIICTHASNPQLLTISIK